MPSQGRSQIKLTIGSNIRAAREAKGLTQAALARRLPGEIDGPSVSRWERGNVTPGLPNLMAIASATDRSVDWFYADHSDESDLMPAA